MSRPTLLGSLSHRTAAALRTAVAALTRHRGGGDLGQMDDHMLRDIGLTRWDVWSDAAEPLFRETATGHTLRAGESRAANRGAARERRVRAALRRLWDAESRTA